MRLIRSLKFPMYYFTFSLSFLKCTWRFFSRFPLPPVSFDTFPFLYFYFFHQHLQMYCNQLNYIESITMMLKANHRQTAFQGGSCHETIILIHASHYRPPAAPQALSSAIVMPSFRIHGHWLLQNRSGMRRHVKNAGQILRRNRLLSQTYLFYQNSPAPSRPSI